MAKLARGLVLAVVLTAALPAAAQQRVGVSSAVNPASFGTPPGAGTHKLFIGDNIDYEERIATQAKGQAQILFLDRSSFTVGPNSEVVIDQFVYDPHTNSGKLVASATKGVFRFVGGALSKLSGGVTFKTPAVTIGIRGGVCVFTVDAATGGVEATLLFGKEMRLTGPNGQTVTLTRFGYSTRYDPQTGNFTAPVPGNDLGDILLLLDGRPGGNGGTGNVPTEEIVAQSGISQVNSGNTTNLTPPDNDPPPPEAPPVDGTEPQKQTPVLDTSLSGTFSGRWKAGYTENGFTDQSPEVNRTYANGTLANGVFSAQLGADPISFPLVPVADGDGSPLLTFESLDPQAQTPLGPALSAGLMTGDHSFFIAELFGNDEQGYGPQVIFGGLPVTPAALAVEAASVRSFVPFDLSSSAITPFLHQDGGGSLVPTGTSPWLVVTPSSGSIGAPGDDPTVSAFAQLAVEGEGAAQQSAIVVATGSMATGQDGKVGEAGSLRGSARLDAGAAPILTKSSFSSVTDPDGNSLFGGNQLSGYVVDQNPRGEQALAVMDNSLEDASPVQYAFNVGLFEVPGLYAARPRATATLTGYAAGLAEPYLGLNFQGSVVLSGSATIVTDATTNQVTGGFDLTGDDDTARNLRLGEGEGRSAYIDNSTFAALDSTTTSAAINGSPATSALFLVSSAATTGVAAAFPEVASCTCEYLKWGFWGGRMFAGEGYTEAYHLNTWVAGQQPDVGAIPSAGTATFDGFAIGSVDNDGSRYIASGLAHGDFDFAQRTGTVTISDFDGRTFGSGVSSANGRDYSGGVAIAGACGSGGCDPGSRITAIQGTFFGDNAHPVAETGGSFTHVDTTNGANYRASGIFAARNTTPTE